MSDDIYVVVCATDIPPEKRSEWEDKEDRGPIVLETYTRTATLENARETCKRFDRLGPCRIARLEFVDE